MLGFVFGPGFVIQYLMSFLVLKTSRFEERAGCYTFIAFYCHTTVSILCFFNTVLYVGLQYVIVAIPGHTHLPFETKLVLEPMIK